MMRILHQLASIGMRKTKFLILVIAYSTLMESIMTKNLSVGGFQNKREKNLKEKGKKKLKHTKKTKTTKALLSQPTFIQSQNNHCKIGKKRLSLIIMKNSL